jgi:cyclopropane-fatty-acyl-phospholipid synthase
VPTPGSSTRRRYELLDRALERGLVPDPLLRAGSRSAARRRERAEARGGVAEQSERLNALLERMSSGPIAEAPPPASQQRYELPPEFLALILGPRRKYSGCLWTPGVRDLAGAEEAMLSLSCERAQVADGMRILDLGCGWGSLSLWLAEQFPGAQITGVSNSVRQREWIEARRDALGLRNLTLHTAELNDFDPRRRFDRVVSIESFEHMRNWSELLRRIADWLRPSGKAFVQLFSHRTLPYRLEGTWAAERFFTGAVMPSHDLLPRFQEHLNLVGDWIVPGTHYARTLSAWRQNLDANADAALRVLVDDGRSESEARRLLAGWRLFLLSTREMWRYRGGNHWLVSHYLLEPRGFRSQPL